MTLSTISCSPSRPSTPIDGTPLIDLSTASSSIDLEYQDGKKSSLFSHYEDFKAIDFALQRYRSRFTSASKPDVVSTDPTHMKAPAKESSVTSELQRPTPKTYPDMEGFEDPGYLLAVSPKPLSSTTTTSTTSAKPLQNRSTTHLSSNLRTNYNRAVHPHLPPALRHKGPARTNLVLAVALTLILGVCISGKASCIGAAVFSFGVFGVLGPFVG